MPESELSPGANLEHLFDMELENRQGMSPVLADRGKLGDYLSSGEGSVFGPNISGEVLWDLFQEQGEVVCGSNLRGIIKSDDGSQIGFESVGYMKRPDMTKPTVWLTTASFKLETEAIHLAWMNDKLAILQGKFDMASNRHSYRIYVQKSV
jgi:hypothetical protein